METPVIKKTVSDETDQLFDEYGYKKDFRTALPQFLAVSVKNLLLLGYGMTLGFPTILIPAVKNPRDGEILHLENSEISWLSSINFVIVPLGSAVSGAVMSPLGRRRAMQMVNLPFLVAWLMFHYSATTWHLFGALFLTGLAGGLLEAPVLTYVAEITQPHLRGALSATSSLCIIIGVFTQFLFGTFLYWRTIALVNITFTVLAFITLYFIPESPHWLVSRHRIDEARKSLQWLRGWKNCSSVESELKDIQALFEHKNDLGKDLQYEALSNNLSRYLERSFISPFLLIAYSFFVGHFSGMTTLQMLEAPIDKYYATLILGLLQIIGSTVCVALVHYTGKRPLTMFSTAGAGVCCMLVAGYDGYISKYGLAQNSEVSTSNITSSEEMVVENYYSWIPTTLLMLLALITHTGIRLLPWILIGEILQSDLPKLQEDLSLEMRRTMWLQHDGFPAHYVTQVFSAKTRSGGAGLAGAAGYILGFITNKMYINMVDGLSLWGTYSIYGIVSLSGCVVFYYVLPETEGKKLNDIEDHFAGIKKMSNKVHRLQNKTISEKTIQMCQMAGEVNHSFEGDCSRL